MERTLITRAEIEFVIDSLNRRRFLTGAAALAGAAILPWRSFAQTIAPHVFQQGEFEVSVFSDGELMLPLSAPWPDATPEQLAEIATRLGWPADTAQIQINIPVIRAGNDIIVFDSGSGANLQPSAGKLVANLRAGGVDPASVTKVVITHAHPDHVWGALGPDNALSFPNASYYVAAAEWDFWMNPGIFNQLPPDLHYVAEGAQRGFGAVEDRVTMVKGGDAIVTGVTVLETQGHTPGHISLEVAGGEGLIITADALQSEVVSFEHTEWKSGFDAVPDQAIATRRALLDRAAADGTKLLGYHFTAPGLGFAENNGSTYRFVAAA